MTPVEPPGLANERTALAWQRTALSVVVGALVVARLTVDRLGPLVLVVSLAGLVLAVWVGVEGRDRYRRRDARAAATTRLPGRRGGRGSLLLAGTVVLVAVTELVALLLG